MASEPAGPYGVNLDWAGADTRLAVVLDGLTESPQTGCVHGTAWYVARLGARLLHHLGSAGAAPLADGLAAAVEEVAGEHRHTCDLGHPGSPGSTVSLLRQTGTEAEYLVLADSPVVLDTAAGPVAVIDDSWKALATPDLAAAADRGTRADLARFIADQQGQRNRPGGYWIARTEPEAAGHALTGTVSGVTGAVLASDGAALLVTDFGLLDWRGYLELAYREGPAGIIAATRAAEKADEGRTRWPRQKVSDDATAAVCLLTGTDEGGMCP